MATNGQSADGVALTRAVTTRLPTRHGPFTVHAYEGPVGGPAHLALVCGDARRAESPILRIHSECLTGDLFGSTRCDCGDQLDAALALMQREGGGILIYLRQEGRGIGLVNKLRAYNLQDDGLDTVDANLALGFDADQRTYEVALAILDDLEIDAVQLLTNNPRKLTELECSPIRVDGRVPLSVRPTTESRSYLETKRDRLGHLIDADLGAMS